MGSERKEASVRGETRLIWGAVRAGVSLAPPGALLGWGLRGPRGAVAVAAALALIVTNLVISGLALVLASRIWPLNFPAVALPSFAIRMAGVFAGMAMVHGSGLADPMVFTTAFAAGLVLVLVYELRLWARTPWLALEYTKEIR
jgi:hypothetical protein